MNKPISRRCFLKIALLTTAAVSLPSVEKHFGPLGNLNREKRIWRLELVEPNASMNEIEATQEKSDEEVLFFIIHEESNDTTYVQLFDTVEKQDFVIECDVGRGDQANSVKAPGPSLGFWISPIQ